MAAATSMSSRILDPDTPIETSKWRAKPSSGSTHAAAYGGGQTAGEADRETSATQPSDDFGLFRDVHRNPADEARIRELDGNIRILERRVEDDTRASREQGQQRGFAEGMQAGVQQEAAKWTEALARLTQAIEEMSKAKTRFRAEVEEDAVKLALVIARKVLNRELSSDPEALTGLARVALSKLNLRELQRVRVHPADAPAIEKMLGTASGPRRLEVIPDGTLERGGAIFETDRGMLDASVTTQLGEIERGLADILGGASK